MILDGSHRRKIIRFALWRTDESGQTGADAKNIGWFKTLDEAKAAAPPTIRWAVMETDGFEMLHGKVGDTFYLIAVAVYDGKPLT